MIFTKSLEDFIAILKVMKWDLTQLAKQRYVFKENEMSDIN